MTTSIYLIRHGQSANNALPEDQRVCDPGLTDTGVKQALLTAKWSTGVDIDHLHCSPFLRSLETTRPIAETKNAKPHIRHHIFELGGCYSGYDAVGKRGEPGMGAAELSSRYAGWTLDESIEDSGWWGQDFESRDAATQRASQTARWLIDELGQRPATHALIIHADFKALLLDALLEPHSITEAQGSKISTEPLYNTGITQIGISNGCVTLVDFNSVAHLDSSSITA